MATVTEIAPDIYRVNVERPGSPVTYSFFVVNDAQPSLVQTGFGRSFPETLEAVRQILDPSTLRYIVIPHFEGDESGALNHFLGQAPHAEAVGSPIGVRTNLSDFAIRPPVAVDENAVLDLGRHRLRCASRPSTNGRVRPGRQVLLLPLAAAPAVAQAPEGCSWAWPLRTLTPARIGTRGESCEPRCA